VCKERYIGLTLRIKQRNHTPTNVKPGHSSSGMASTILHGSYSPKSNLPEIFDLLIGSQCVKTASSDCSSTHDTASFEMASNDSTMDKLMDLVISVESHLVQ